MKKRIISAVIFCLLLVSSIVTAFATVIPVTKTSWGYANKAYVGSSMWVSGNATTLVPIGTVGTYATSYSRVWNDASASYYCEVQVYEKSESTGIITAQSLNSGTVASNSYLDSGDITRHYTDTSKKYLHYAFRYSVMYAAYANNSNMEASLSHIIHQRSS